MIFPQNGNPVSRVFSCKVFSTGFCVPQHLEGVRAKANHWRFFATPWFIIFISYRCDDNDWDKVSLGQECGKGQHHEGLGWQPTAVAWVIWQIPGNWPLLMRTQSACKCFRWCRDSCSLVFHLLLHSVFQSISSDAGAQSFDIIPYKTFL